MEKDEIAEIENSDEVLNEIETVENENAEEVSDEIEITIEGESLTPSEVEDETKAPEWVKDLRKQHRELVKENKELKAKIEESKPKDDELKLSPKPTLAECEYDADLFEERLEKWYVEKQTYEDKQKQIEQAKLNEQKLWEDKVNNYTKEKSELKVSDFDSAEDVVKTILSNTQQAIIVDVVKNPAVIVYALGKNEKLLNELASLKPAQFAHALGKLETKLKITDKKSPPVMRIPNGNANANGVDSTLDKLRDEAEKTGDYTKVFAYKKQLKTKT